MTDNYDGLTFYKKLINESINLLNPNGYMILETGGENQYQQVKQIYIEKNYNVIVHKDQNNANRFLEINF